MCSNLLCEVMTMTNRQLAALETKKKLLHAAKEIICEKGLANVSVAEITKKCGVANGTFYTYFKRKEDIVFALSREMYREVLDKALEYPGTFMERLSFFMTSFTDRIEKSGLKLCQEWVRNTVDPDLVENEDDRSKLAFDIHSLTVLLEDGIERGELASDAPVSILAYTLADILYGEMLCWDMSGGAYCYAKRTEEFCKLFLGSIMAPYLIRKDVTQ